MFLTYNRIYKFIFIVLFFIFQRNLIIAQSNSIPFQYYKGHLYFQGFVKNNKGNFIFDTGAGNLYLDSLFYDHNTLNYNLIDQVMLPGGGTDQKKVSVIRNNVEFTFGENKYQTRIVPILNLKPILGDFVDGILGLDFFQDKIVELNYTDSFFRIHDNFDSLDLNQYSKIRLVNNEKRYFIYLSVQINDSVSINDYFMIDLGSSNSISLTSPTARKHELSEILIQKVLFYTNYGGISGRSEHYVFNAKSITLGDHTLPVFNAEFSIDQKGEFSSSKHAGLIGNEILKKFDLIFDFESNHLYLKPNIHYNKNTSLPFLGFSYVDRSKTYGALVVTGFYKDSPAEKSGLLLDDHIVEINQTPVKDIPFQEMLDFLTDSEVLRLKIKRLNTNVEISLPLTPFVLEKTNTNK